MGKKFRETSGADTKELIADLNKAYCDEWLAYYAYTYAAQAVSGKGYEDMQEFLEKIAKEELEHQEELSDMIQKLGGMPVANPSDLEKSANFPYPKPPKDTADYDKIIEFVLEAEGNAIDVYRKLVKKTAGKEDVVCDLIKHILAEEVDHEETFENLK